MATATSSQRSSHSPEVEGSAKRRRRRANLARHARKCTVCHHRDRESIDQDYLGWRSPEMIAHEYGIAHHSAIYRHAEATGLRARRRATLRATLDNFIEQAESIRVTAGSVIAAIRLHSQINDEGQWTPAPKRYIIERRYTTCASEDTKAAATTGPHFPPSHAADSSPAATSDADFAVPLAKAQKNSSHIIRTSNSERSELKHAATC